MEAGTTTTVMASMGNIQCANLMTTDTALA